MKDLIKRAKAALEKWDAINADFGPDLAYATPAGYELQDMSADLARLAIAADEVVRNVGCGCDEYLAYEAREAIHRLRAIAEKSQ